MPARLVTIGASEDGADALQRLIAALPADFPAPLVVTHHPGDTRNLASGRLEVMHPGGPEPLVAGRVHVAPPDRHIIVTRGQARPSLGPPENLLRPAVDAMFRSAALAYGPSVIALLLARDPDDGAAGLLAVEERGGTALRGTAVGRDPKCVAEMLAALARSPAGPDPGAAPDALTVLENVIAAGTVTFAHWLRFGRLVERSGLACPGCGGDLHLLPDRRIVRFRCGCGRAYSARTLVRVKAQERRDALRLLAGISQDERALARLMEAEAPPIPWAA
jgi:two-component system chemotaxis response regulator CheB